MGQKAMATGQIHHPATPVFAPDPSGGFPGFIKFFSGQGTGPANGPGNLVKESV